jgi:hypothetical protein
MEVFEGSQREYVAPDVGCATGVCTTTCAPVGGVLSGGYATTGYSAGAISGVASGAGLGGPLVRNRKIPLKERALAKVTGRPVVTNYH